MTIKYFTFINENLRENNFEFLHAASKANRANLKIFLNFLSDIILVLALFSALISVPVAVVETIVVEICCISEIENKKRR